LAQTVAIFSVMRLLTCAFASPTEFLDCYSVESAEGVLYCRTRSELAVGEELVVEVSFPGMPNRTLMRGSVAALRRGRGLWIRLHAGDAHTRDFILRLARGEFLAGDPVERSHRRIPVALPVTCHIDEVDDPPSDRLLGTTHDVGGGGAWIQVSAPPAVGTRVSLVLGPMAVEGETFRLDGRVAWIRRDSRAHGFGVRFDPKESRDGPRLRAMLRRACESGWVGFAARSGGWSTTRSRG
jgi:Tfp pilus assembly protein PilZ